MLWSIDSCQNRVSADQYDMTLLRAQVLTHPGNVFFEVLRCQVTSFQLIAGSTLQWLQVYLFEVNYKFTYGSVALSLKYEQQRDCNKSFTHVGHRA